MISQQFMQKNCIKNHKIARIFHRICIFMLNVFCIHDISVNFSAGIYTMLTNKKNNNMLLREFCYLSTYVY